MAMVVLAGGVGGLGGLNERPLIVSPAQPHMFSPT